MRRAVAAMKCTFRTWKCLTLVGAVIVLLASATEASVQQPREPSVQEAILRAKPAVALVVVEVAADVLLALHVPRALRRRGGVPPGEARAPQGPIRGFSTPRSD